MTTCNIFCISQLQIFFFFNQSIMFMSQWERQAKGKWNSTFVRNSIFKKKTFSVNFCFIEGVDNPSPVSLFKVRVFVIFYS